VPAQNKLQMRQLDPGWAVHPILWVAIVGDPGTNKSATVGYAIEPIEYVEKSWRAEHRAAQRKEEAARRSDNGAASSEAPPKSADDIFTEPTAPAPYRQKRVTDAIGTLLEENQDGLLFFQDELSGWIGGTDAYRARSGKDRPFWLEAKEGRPFPINRKGSKRIIIPSHAVSVLGGIQPDKMRELAPKLAGDGLLQRFMPILIDRRGNGVDVAPEAGLEDRRDALALALADSERRVLFKFEPEAAGELSAVQDFVACEIERPSTPPMLAQWLEKLPNEFGRVALVFHFIEWQTSQLGQPPGATIPELVSKATAQRSRRYLIEFVFPHARAFYGQVLAQSAADENAKWVAGYILAHGVKMITERDLNRTIQPLKGKERAGNRVAAMYELEMRDWVRPTRWGSDGKPNMWEVNPAVHDGRFLSVAAKAGARRSEMREIVGATGGAERRMAA
jgi:hypothetical protein